MNFTQLTQNYFDLFSSKDIDGLRKLYDPQIRLLSWNEDFTGVEEVLNANSQLFSLEFKLNVISISEAECQTFNYITVEINDDVLNVMDVITFNDHGKIVDITAYRR